MSASACTKADLVVVVSLGALTACRLPSNLIRSGQGMALAGKASLKWGVGNGAGSFLLGMRVGTATWTCELEGMLVAAVSWGSSDLWSAEMRPPPPVKAYAALLSSTARLTLFADFRWPKQNCVERKQDPS